jgi:hypothetical protein
MSEGRPTGLTVIKLAWCCLLAGVVAAALMFPIAGGLGLLSNRASDIVAHGSAQLLEVNPTGYWRGFGFSGIKRLIDHTLIADGQ